VANRRRALGWFAPGLAAVAAAATVLVWPLDANGLSGNALRPQYSDFGWFAYGPLPDNPSTADLRRAGVAVPQDVVTHRRQVSAGVGLVGLALMGGSLVRLRRRRL
jgi:hypothetical protein